MGWYCRRLVFSVSLDSHVFKRTPKHVGLPGPISKTHGSFPYESRDSKMGVEWGVLWDWGSLKKQPLKSRLSWLRPPSEWHLGNETAFGKRSHALTGSHQTFWIWNSEMACILSPIVMKIKNSYGGFRTWWYSQIIHFNRDVHYKSSILGYHHLRKHPYDSFAVM